MTLIGDIGGTKIDLAVIAPGADPREPGTVAEFASARYPDLETAVREYRAGVAAPVERACFAVAGPVIAGRVRATNLPWVLDESALARGLGLTSVTLLNDLEATARAVPFLRPGEPPAWNGPRRGGRGLPPAPPGRYPACPTGIYVPFTPGHRPGNPPAAS